MLTTNTVAQRTSVMASSGQSNTQHNNTVSWTLGESVIITGKTSNTVISQGFHQPFKIDSTIHSTHTLPVYLVYPNPTTSEIYLKAQNNDEFPVSIKIIDASGKTILIDRMTQSVYHTNIATFDAGVYFITLLNNKNDQIKTYKIIKL